MSKQVTAKEFAAEQGIEGLMASTVLSFLAKKGQIKLLDEKRPSATGKGRSANVYEIPESVTITL